MAITNSGMTLYADHDTQESWVGTDDLDDYNMSVQGANSESWLVGKNVSETGTMSLAANMASAKYFTTWMQSNLTNYYTSITMALQDSNSGEEVHTIASSTNRKVTGEFHPFILEFGQGVGTVDNTIITDFECVLASQRFPSHRVGLGLS